ncbi:replicative DNA helicase [Paenibacillus sp. LMG 31456]|uniref:Replicative DNA helicase n=1 Tax=Paenibacillus foliorum TaxID=2654974 RepID=A0A972GXJ2_9BACL|nr:replicative DNA helicase [Paenibacillus foliorum]NOU95612.1 replicative DNA helicase [Paenibacillus foliorum]
MESYETVERPIEFDPEQAVIGAILLDNDAIITVLGLLLPDDFQRVANRIIYESMIEIYDANEPIDLITLIANLQRRKQLENVGGPLYLSSIAGAVPTAANVDYYAKIVQQDSISKQARKRLIQLSQDDEMGAAEIVAAMQETASDLAGRSASNRGFRTFVEVGTEFYEDLEHRHTHPSEGGVTGITSGFPDLDKMTSGFQPSDLIIVAARPSVGKTAFALNVAQSAGKTCGEPVAVFSLEMGAKQLVQRMVSAEGNVDASRIRTGYLEQDDWEKVTMAMGALSDANIFIDDSPSITVNEIRAKCRKLKKEKGLGMILIDYLQLISGNGRKENRQQEVSEISRTLKQIARELDVPVIALSQLSRGVEQRQDKRPMMSDIRESGSIEQDADIVAFLYRDDYYDKETEKKNIIEIIIAKQRNGPVGTVELAFLKNFNKFVTLDRTHQEEPIRSKSSKNIPDMRRRSG